MNKNSDVLCDGQVIFNGGNPIKDCPTDYAWADKWANEANQTASWAPGSKGIADQWWCPVWSWDCGFKLDFDGPIVRFNSRFYPPKTHQGDKWSGSITVYVFSNQVHYQTFECETLDELQTNVEDFTKEFAKKITDVLSSGLKSS
jgi:hypothetical protein